MNPHPYITISVLAGFVVFVLLVRKGMNYVHEEKPSLENPKFWYDGQIKLIYTTEAGNYSIDENQWYYFWNEYGDNCYGPFKFMAQCQEAQKVYGQHLADQDKEVI